MYSPRLPLNLDISIGDTATQTIRSPQYIEFQTKDDIEKTNQLRNTRRRLIKPIYAIDTTVQKNIKENITQFFTDYQSQASQQFYETHPFITLPQQQTLRSLSQSELIELEATILSYLNTLLQSGIKEINKASIRKKVAALSDESSLNNTLRLTQQIIEAYLKPNLKVDDDQTKKSLVNKCLQFSPLLRASNQARSSYLKGKRFQSFISMH